MSDQPARPYIGGQAVIEGVMMRSPSSVAIVCRRRSGELVVREQPMTAVSKGARTWPFVRGIATLVESLRLGSQALRWSTDLYEQDLSAEEAGSAKGPESKRSSAGQAGGVNLTSLALSMAAIAAQDVEPAQITGSPAPGGHGEGKKRGGGMGMIPILFAVLLFVAAPQAGAELVNKLLGLGLEVTSPAFQAITGVAKLAIVVGYLLLIRQIPEVRRVFQYHGAEHKAISTYEAREVLEVENARRKTAMHPRCGTTFLVMVALVSIVVFSVAGASLGALLPKLPGGRLVESVTFFLMKLPFLPLIAAVTFEIQRIFARYCTTGPLRVLLWPGFLVQKITTAEPDDAQLEIALASLRATLWREASVAAPVQPDRVFADYSKLLADPGYAGAHG
ncbi:DUF1385 domain-containing protein [Sorangium atrum]|uniref:DUF1385 domain-containing protein n=1 Tax=Sorangium atrum TaxID=2995308 RepID=A0ABT5C245_9BACT|nr:DUF1385 domain-containing protein [Sorangium aterium]MDC0679763.1 DUF1385 domain-containing protein [Sorangium aterium]